MKRIQNRLGSLFTAAAMLLSLAVTPAMAANTKDPPTAVTASSNIGSDFVLDFGYTQSDWAGKITDVQVNGESWTRVNYSFYIDSNKNYYVASSDAYVYIGEGFSGDEVTCVISATGYNDLTLKLNKTNHTAEVVENSGSNSGSGGSDSGNSGSDSGNTGSGEATKNPPTEMECAYTSGFPDMLTLTVNDSTWLAAVAAKHATLAVNNMTYTYEDNFGTFCSDNYWHVNGNSIEFVVTSSYSFFPAVFTLSADGYKDVKITVSKTGNWPNESVSAVAEIVGGSGSTETPDTSENGTVAVSDVTIEKDNSNWVVSYANAEGYVSKIQTVKVNGTEWTSTPYGPYSGGSYKKNIDENTLAFAQNDNLVNPAISALKSGDVITITATGYKDLTFKLVIDTNGKASVVEDDGQGDPYKLHVKIDGSFEAAIVGQKDYDGVSSASVGGASSNKNSAVTVYSALMEKGTKPTDADWKKTDASTDPSTGYIDGGKCSVNIVPDTKNGTKADANSGMKGVYMPAMSSDLTLDGTPEDAGRYLISVSIADNQGRTATSNTLPFRIYTGEETLAEQIKTENLKQYQSGLYAWDIMEPWAIKNFGSNVDGEENSVRVPEKLEVWYGSHESGTYGVLGYDIPWDDVKASNIPQTLYIPNGCNLTLMNMKILSSVRIVVENGGKLTLRDSTVQGIIDVQSGGTFSMNYDSFNQKFETGASICGQLRMEDGSTLENAAIYSHTNYLANGNLTDRSNDDAVVAVSGNVTVKGQVFIRGDEAGSTGKGQTALCVSNGTLTLADDAVLVTYGGGGIDTLYSSGGSAVELDNGKIAGKGKLVAIGGPVLFGSGDEAVAGTGSIDVSEVFLQGATAYERGKGAQPGKAYANGVTVKADKQHVADGELIDAVDDPLAGLYWKTGIDATPDLNKYIITPTPGYVLMNIPYNAFYAAEKGDNDMAARVDAVSSATKSKPLSSLAANSYHNNSDGSDISGITYPVYVSDLSALRDCRQITDDDTLTITVTLRGQNQATTYTGKEALFGAPDYAYYVLSETPTSYKELTVSNGTWTFSKATATATAASGASATLTTNGHHTYYELKVAGLAKDIASKVSAVTLHTTDGNVYGLRHVVEIWRGTELGFGVDSGLQGKTIDTISYYLNDGTIQTIGTNLKIPKSTKNVTATVENALNTAHETAVTVTGLLAEFDAAYTVTSGSTDLSTYNFAVADGKLTWEGTPAFGAYTLTITDTNGVYAPVLTTFELKTADIIAKYDASKKVLVKASDAITEEQFAAYLKAISAVSVDGTSYAASGRGAVTIVKTDGAIDLTAAPFSKGDGASYSVVVKATGYQDLAFTLEVPKQSNHSSGSSGSASGGSSSSSGSSYAVSAPSAKNGDVTVSPKNASKGDRVTITVTPDKGYELDKLIVKDASGNKLKLTDKGNGKYTFTMPGSKVTVSAEFVEEQAASTFADVPADAYYAKAVEWAQKLGITNGKTDALFGSNDPCTRGQIVTFLWRAAGSPAPKGTATVPADVLPGSYCYGAVAWALENGVTNGFADGTFGVNSTCTRGQSVTFLYRALGTAPTTVNGFTDVAAGDFYAEAVAWAVENGVTNGTTDSTFSPSNGCTRSQIVAFLWRAMTE